MRQLLQDLRVSLRVLRKDHAFTVIAVLTLTLGIGANSAVFSIVNALMLRPYPFAHLDQLVLVRPSSEKETEEGRIPPADFIDLRREAATFQGLSAFQYKFSSLTESENAEPVLSCAVTPNFFDMIGAHPRMGRAFAADEGEIGRDQVALLNHGYWQRRFASDPGVVGRTLQVNGRGYTVIGIMPENFNYPPAVEMWTPLALTSQHRAERNAPMFQVLGRLRPQQSLRQAQQEAGAFAARLQQQFPETHRNKSLSLLRLREEQYRFYASLFLMLQAAAVFVLMLAAVNLLNLLLARLLGRQRELAVRSALGASRWRLARLFMSETIPLALFAGLCALACAAWTVEAIRNSVNRDYTKWVAGWNFIQVDERVVAVTLALTIVAGALFGLGAAWRTGRRDLNLTLKEAGRSSAGAGRNRFRSVLAALQMVFATVLMIGAGLMVKGFLHLTDIYKSLDPGGVLISRITLPEQRYAKDASIRSFYQQALEGIAALPGVDAAGLVTNPPASNVDNPRTPFVIDGRPLPQPGEVASADLQAVSQDFFRSLHIPLLEGRSVSNQDGTEAPRVAIISRTMARQFWPGGTPLGQRIKLGAPGSSGAWIRLVGVVGDVKQNWWENAPRPVIYLPYSQSPRRTMEFTVRTAGAAGVASGIRRVLHALDAGVSSQEGVKTLEGSIADSLAPLRILGILMLIFGVVAMLLAALGVYVVLAHAVAQRTNEFGIRMALGARRADVLRLVLGQAWKLSAIGVGIGLAAAFVAVRVTASLLYGVIVFNAVIFVALALMMIAVALLAAYVPARRAIRLDPLLALRCD